MIDAAKLRAQREDASTAIRVDATDVECPVCDAWVGWACKGADYGYHAAGYHPSRQRAADQAAAAKEINMSTETTETTKTVETRKRRDDPRQVAGGGDRPGDRRHPLQQPMTRISAMAAERKSVARFWLQPTATFSEGAPQRENYINDSAFNRACVKYATEWRETYRCAGCDEVECPQCGAEGSVG